MTNEQFIKCLNILQTAVKNADSEVMSQIVEHAKKLVAVAEAAKEIGHERSCNAQLIGDCECGYYDLYIALENLERE